MEGKQQTHNIRNPIRCIHNPAWRTLRKRRRTHQHLRAIIDADLEHVNRAVGLVTAGLIFLVLGDVNAAPFGGSNSR